jgi:hypothetical protein
MVVQPCVGPWHLLEFRISFYAEGRTPWTSVQPCHKVATYTQISMPGVGFELMIPTFEAMSTIQALDRAATVIDTH